MAFVYTDQCSRPIRASLAWLASPSLMLRMKCRVDLVAVLGLIAAGEARELPCSGGEACVQIEGGKAQFAVLDAAVVGVGG